MPKKMLIDATHPEETRVVVVDGNKVEDFDFESVNKRQLAGNIYLAKVTRVEPSLQAAFVEYGGNRHGFLAFSEIHPDYYQIPVADREALLAEEAREEEAERAREDEDEARPRRGRNRRERGEAKAKRGTVSGLEVIDVDGLDGREVPPGLEVAAPDGGAAAAADPPAREGQAGARTADASALPDAPPADAPAADTLARAEARRPRRQAAAASEAVPDAAADGETDTAEADPPAVSADVAREAPEYAALDIPEETPAGEDGEAPSAAPAEDDDATPPSSAPRSVAESAGLDNGDRLTEEIDADASAQGKTRDDLTGEAADGSVAETPVATGEAATLTGAPEAEIRGDTATAPDAPDSEPAAQERTASAEDEARADPGEQGGRRRRRRRGRDDKAEPADRIAAGAPAQAPEARGNGNGETDEVEQPEQIGAEDTLEEAARARFRLRRRYKIQDVVKVRQIMLVQVVKEERGNKGAALTTYLSLAGRYCVLMPNTARGGGISRKITNAGDRKRLRDIADELDVPRGMGLIVRTAGAERTRAEIKRDYEFLLRQWEQIRDLTLKSIAPTLIYEEGSLIKRSIRDLYSKEIDQILVEGEAGYREAKEYMKMLMPSHAKNVQPYADPVSLFGRYQVESYLNAMFNPTVQLRSGGYIVIGVTEALVAIDVNSGRATKQGSIEETALQTNLEAAEEISRQLRLRDLAGLIVIDFIDMDENRNNRAVEKRMKERLKSDRARIQMGRISAFGLMEMSRQRLRPGMLEATTKPCPHCHGVGLIRSDDSLALAILREVEEEGLRGRADEITVRAPVDIANYLINAKRRHVAQIETRNGISVLVVGDPTLVSPNYELVRAKGQGKRPAPAARDVVSAASVVTEAELADEAEETEARADDRAEDGAEDRSDARSDDEARSRRRRGRRGGRRRRGEGEEAREPREARDDQDETDRGDRPGEDEEDDKPRGRRGRGRRRRGRRGDDQGGDREQRRAEGDGHGAVPDETGQAMTGQTVAGQAVVGEALGGGAMAGETVLGQGATGNAMPGETPTAETATGEAEPEAPRPETRAEALADIAPQGNDTLSPEERGLRPAPAAAHEPQPPAETGGVPLPSGEAPADVAGLDAALAGVAGPEERAHAVRPPWEVAETDTGEHLGASGAAETDAPPAATETRDQAAGPAPAGSVEEEKAPEPAKPKKRGWWSLGL